MSRNALKKANEILADRKRDQRDIDLADCLEFPHKAAIILKTPSLATIAGLKRGKPGARFVHRLTTLRNNLAHAQDIITGYWPGIIELVGAAELLLSSCERADLRIDSPSRYGLEAPVGGTVAEGGRTPSPTAPEAGR